MLQVRIDTWLKVIAIGISIAVPVGLPMSLACLEIRDAARDQRAATALMAEHMRSSESVHSALKTADNELRVRVSVNETRIGAVERKLP